MKKIIVTILVITSACFNIIAQEKSEKELKGDKFYNTYAFDKAIDHYTQAKDLTVEGERRLAESYHNINLDVQSESTYSKLINNKVGVVPDDYYSYAMVLKANGKYDQAEPWMNKFKELKPDDLRAKNYAANNADLKNLQVDDGKYKIVHLDINTDAEDFGPCYYKNKLVFTSSRQAETKLIVHKYNWNRKPFLDMFVGDIDKDNGQLTNVVSFDKGLNGKLHDGPACFNKDGTFMAFTRDNYDDKNNQDVKLQIFFSSYKNGAWTKAEPFFLNNKDYSVGDPCLTEDGNTMYFASDMPGGYGGSDIYRITKDEKGEWGKPENLGNKINTEGNEMFPFYEENSEIMFFSSNGHLGLGGLDNFFCAVNGTEFGKVKNWGYPINTQYDDFAMIINDKFSNGYFSSNRKDGSGDDDIYHFDLLKGLDIGKKLKGITKDKSGNPVSKTFVTLFDEKGNVIDTLTTKGDGAFSFLVDNEKKYKLVGKKEKYLDGDTTANTFGKEYVVKADIIMDKVPEAIARKIEVGADLGKILELNPIYFDLDKYNIRPDAKIELDKIVKIMNAYPNMIVELGSHTDCRGTYAYNQVLSDNRARESAEYIKKRITKPTRIYGKGYGETKLVNGCACEGKVVSNCSEEEHQKNRRTEFIIVKQ